MTDISKRGGARPGAGHKRGTPGTPRPTAGRKPQSWRLRNGDTMAVWVGGAMGNVGTVEVSNRNVLYLRLDDGSEIKLVR